MVKKAFIELVHHLDSDTELVLHQQRDFVNQNATATVGTFFHARPAWSFTLKSSSLSGVVIPFTGSSIALPRFHVVRLDRQLLTVRASPLSWPFG